MLCPVWYTSHPEWVGRFYDPDFGVGYIFLSNLIASAVTLLVLVPEIVKVRYRFDTEIWRRMIVYSFPLLVMGLAGIMNQTIDKLIYPWLVGDPDRAMSELGVYGANYKIAIVMVMFIQSMASLICLMPVMSLIQDQSRKAVSVRHAVLIAERIFVIC